MGIAGSSSSRFNIAQALTASQWVNGLMIDLAVRIMATNVRHQVGEERKRKREKKEEGKVAKAGENEVVIDSHIVKHHIIIDEEPFLYWLWNSQS